MAGVKRSIEMLVLGLIAEKPSHAYLLKRSIDRLIGGFHRVSDGMLYPLLRELEERRYISGREEKGDHAPDKVVYTLTKEGEERIGELLASPLRSLHYGDSMDFFARFALFGHLSSSERVKVLRERLKVCDSALQKLAAAAEGIPSDGYAFELIRRFVEIVEGECEWLMGLISKEIAAEGAMQGR